MEPQEPPKNDHTEGTGFFKRRISSILKTPGKLARFADPEQQENVVERVKPVEKRNSRRVSFAPANDVLLFSKDAKSTSPVRCPLQELASARPASQNRVQVAAEEEIQPITAMETLLNAPLHGSQQQDTVCFDSVGGFGEKTVMFSSEDAFMDMTHCHSMLSSADVEKNATDSSQDLSTEKKKTTQRFHPGFEDFLLSISQPPSSSSSSSSSAAKTNSSVAAMKRQNVNKENLLPVSVMTKAKEPDLATNLAQDQTGPVLSDSDDDNPFPLFFPNQESKERSNKERSKTTAVTKSAPEDPVPSKTPPLNVFHPKPKLNCDGGDRTLRFAADEEFMDMTLCHTVSRGPVPPQQVEPGSLCGVKPGVVNRSVHIGTEPQTRVAPAGQDKTIRFDMDDDGAGMDMTRCLTVALHEIQRAKPLRDQSSSSDPSSQVVPKKEEETLCLGFPLKPSLKVKQQNPQDKLDVEDERRERTVRFSADDTDATQSQSVHVGTDVRPLPTSHFTGGDKTIRFDVDDADMDMTRCLTVALPEIQSAKPLRDQSSSSDPSSQDVPLPTSHFTGGDVGVNMTEVQLANRADLNRSVHIGTKVQLQTPLAPAGRDKTIRFGLDDAGMDMTRCLTGKINLGMDPDFPEIQSVTRGPLTIDDGVKRTEAQSATRADTNRSVHIGTKVQLQTPLAPAGRDKTIRFDLDDAGMDMTRCLTGKINLGADPDLPEIQHVTRAPLTIDDGVKRTEAQLANHADTNRSVHIRTEVQLYTMLAPAGRDKTIRFDLDDAGMDMTRCLTGKINLGMDPVLPEIQSVTRGPLTIDDGVKRTEAQSANHADTNRSVHIGTKVQLQTPLAPEGRDKTIRFDLDDAGMDMTCCLTGKINLGADSVLPEKTIDDGVKMTEAQSANRTGLRFSLTPSLLTNQPKQQENSDLRERTVRFSNDLGSDSMFLPEKRQEVGATERDSSAAEVKNSMVDVRMDLTEAQTGRSSGIARSEELDRDSNSATYVAEPFRRHTDSQFSVKKRGRSLAAERSLGLGFESSSSRKSAPWIKSARTAAPDAPPEDLGTKGRLEVDPGTAAPGLVPVAAEKPDTESTAYFDLSMEMTEAQTGRVLGRSFGDELPQSEDAKVELLEQTEATSRQSQEPPALNASKETTSPSNQSDANQDEDEERPCKSRRMSLADLQSKLRRMSQAACAAPVPSAEPEINTSANEEARDESGEMEAPATPVPFNSKTNQLMSRLSMGAFGLRGPRLDPGRAAAPDAPTEDPGTQGRLAVDPGTAAPGLVFAAAANPGRESTAYFDLSMEMTEAQTGRVLGRSFGDELPRSQDSYAKVELLEQAEATSRQSRETAASSLIQSGANQGEDEERPCKSRRMSLADLQSKLRRMSDAETNIFAEELDSVEDSVESSVEDVPETPEKEMGGPQGADPHHLPQEVAFDEDFISGKKKMAPLEDEINPEDEERLEASAEATDELVDMELPPDPVEWDRTATSCRSMSALTYDFSGHTAGVRHEATFESTLKQSTMFESQLEDYACDAQMKLREGTITVLEFLKLFNIDFVIHNPRQSILPGRISPEEDQTLLDALRDRHINRPKQLVYETDVWNLTEKVEGLKVRLQDLHKPLVTVNQSLWEEMSNASETELRAFGAALKQRNNLFRKTCKALSHEMKEELYSNVVQANREEQRKLRGTIKQADEMIKSLDDCIGQLEAELTAVEETGFKDKPSLRSLQEEMKKANEALSEKERQISERELETKQNLSKLSRVKAQTRKLQELQDAVHLVNEWKLGENDDKRSVFSFLHDTFHLQLLYGKSTGDGAVKKISKINFRFELDDEKSRCCARLVHTLLTRHVQSQTSWEEKYPTSRHVPQLLHDVSLVVSRCRLLGEELRLLALWGGLRLHILHISCQDTQVHIVFSSLKKLAKFEVVFDVCLTDGRPAVKVQRVKNVIGSAPIEQIEDMVASFAPSKNLLTKIIKKIHEGLLS